MKKYTGFIVGGVSILLVSLILFVFTYQSSSTTMNHHLLVDAVKVEIKTDSSSTLAHLSNQELIEKIKHITQIPYIENCNDEIFREIVRRKLDIVPLLLDKLTDMTPLPDQFTPYQVGDVAYMLLEEIVADIPTFELMGVPFSKECGYCSYWNYVQEGFANRDKFQRAVKKWYHNNKKKLVWVESHSFLTADCGGHPNRGHYKVNKAVKTE